MRSDHRTVYDVCYGETGLYYSVIVVGVIDVFCVFVAAEVRQLCEKVSLCMEPVLHRRAGSERLTVLRCSRWSNNLTHTTLDARPTLHSDTGL